MDSLRVEFLDDNLSHGIFERETAQQVLSAQPLGRRMRTSEGWPIVAVGRGGKDYEFDGPIHHDVIEGLGRETDCAVVVFGIGAGNTVRALRAAKIPVLAVFEPEPGILRSFLEAGPSDLMEVPIVTTLRELDTIWSRAVGDRDNVHVVDCSGYARAFASERVELTTKIADFLEKSLVNEQTIRARGRVWIEDIIENAEYLASAPSAHHLQGAYAGVPAFIVGAGPSLNKNIARLHDARKKGIVFAVNTSGRALDRAGITPHVLAALESIDVSNLISGLSFIDEVVRLYSLTAHPQLFRTGQGPLLTLFELLPHIAGPFEAFFGRPGLPVCGSVSTACFSLAYRMGCDPIVMVGQDMAYTGGVCYANGTPFEGSRTEIDEESGTLRHQWCETKRATHSQTGNALLPGEKGSPITAWGGQGRVISVPTFSHVRMWFERVASLLKESGGPRLINATEGGARIANFEELALADLLYELPEQAIEARDIEATARSGGPRRSLLDVSDLFYSNLQGAEAIALVAQRLADKSATLDGLWSTNNPAQMAPHFRELQGLEEQLKAIVNQYPWADAFAWDAVDSALESTSDFSDLPQGLSSIRSEHRLAVAIRDAAKELAERLNLKHSSLKERHEKNS